MTKKQYTLLGLLILTIVIVTVVGFRRDSVPAEPTTIEEPEQKVEVTTPSSKAGPVQTPIEATSSPTIVPGTGTHSTTTTPPQTNGAPEVNPVVTVEQSRFDTGAMLLAHNIARTDVGTRPLVWSETLARSAQSWSDKLKAEECEFRHDPDTGYGENIYWAWRTDTDNSSLISKPEDALDWWVNEVNFYNYDKNTCKAGEQCGHYTQVVWKETREVGCGVSTCFDDGKQTDVWVCRYNPAGNDGMRPY
jgi:pathogenesis-related protein 1